MSAIPKLIVVGLAVFSLGLGIVARVRAAPLSRARLIANCVMLMPIGILLGIVPELLGASSPWQLTAQSGGAVLCVTCAAIGIRAIRQPG